MKPLFNINDIGTKYNGFDLVPFECEYCGNTFNIAAKYVKSTLKRKLNSHLFCGSKCLSQSKITSETFNCKNCNKEGVVRVQSQKSKSGNQFCSQSCSATYNNAHRTTGTRRSKLEQWLENKLTETYPDINIIFNGKKTINSELDIYLPEFKLAFELNGIFHYEPIYGEEKLASIKNNDTRKFQACLENKIELVIIDVSGQTYFKPKTSQKYLDIITNIINDKINKTVVP